MGPRDRAVDHRVFIVGIDRQQSKDAGPDSTFGPAAVPPVGVVPVAEAFREVAPGDTRAIPVEHRVHEKAVVRGGYPNRPCPPGQSVLDPVPLIIAESFVAHWSAFDGADTLRIEEIAAPEPPSRRIDDRP